MDRKHTAIYRMTDHWNDDYVHGTPEDRIGLVWLLTREIASLSTSVRLTFEQFQLLSFSNLTERAAIQPKCLI